MNTSKSTYWYISLQFSAIQKTVLRHDRLWSMVGMSQILSRLNEIELPNIVKGYENAIVLVAGGGKFTARFLSEADALAAREKAIRLVSTKLPMLEFQVVDKPMAAPRFDVIKQNILDQLSEQKRSFRGYGVSFNPLLETCGECGEYPSVTKETGGADDDDEVRLCRVCAAAKSEARRSLSVMQQGEKNSRTTIERIYIAYMEKLGIQDGQMGKLHIPLDFVKLFPGGKGKEKERRRMAVWFSDLNSMRDKVRLWLGVEEEKIKETFDQVKQVTIDIVSGALWKTFPLQLDKKNTGESRFLPFRLVVAGGDDLCLVMPDDRVATFALELSKATRSVLDSLGEDNPLSQAWLRKALKESQKKPAEGKEQTPNIPPGIAPYSFGGAFVVTSLHTPFRRIHELGETLLGEAKGKSERAGNAVTWRIMAEGESQSERLLDFHRPLFVREVDRPRKNDILAKDNPFSGPTFEHYLELAKDRQLSTSHLSLIAGKMIEWKDDPDRLDDWLKRQTTAGLEKSFAPLLKEPALRGPTKPVGGLRPERVAALFEVMGLSGGER